MWRNTESERVAEGWIPAWRVVLLLSALLCFAVASPARAQTTFVVNSTGNESDFVLADGLCFTILGTCTLRAAIQQANFTPGADFIHFNITSGGPPFIIGLPPLDPLPNITETVTIDGSTQPGYASVCTAAIPSRPNYGIIIDGAPTLDGLTLAAGSDGSVIRGLNIIFFNNGVRITGSDDNTVECSFIGTRYTGQTSEGNFVGVRIDSGAKNNTVGGNTDAAANLISGNLIRGVTLDGAGTDGNKIEGNYIGLRANGTTALSNPIGIVIENGAEATRVGGVNAGNVISGNVSEAIQVTGNNTDDTLIQGNYIGTDAGGTTAVPNGTGVYIGGSADGTLVGGTGSGAGNVISGNSAGIVVAGAGTSGTRIEGNRIGTEFNGMAAVPNDIGVVVGIDPTTTIIGGTATGARNVISGNSSFGVRLSSNGTQVVGNYIGPNASGLAAQSKQAVLSNGIGIQIDNGSGNVIGGTTGAHRNIISGNTLAGILLTGEGTTGNLIRSNYIGTDPAGTGALANGIGIRIEDGSTNTVVGGTSASLRNVISGNNTHGVRISGASTSGNTLLGNYIGTDAGGTSGLGNGVHGVLIETNAQNNTVGGTTASSGNRIAFNGQNGATVTGTSSLGTFYRNSFFDNAGLGIDLLNDGSTGNDADDPDAGPNRLQNFPDLEEASINLAGDLFITYSVNTAPANASYNLRVELYKADSGQDEGEVFLATDTYSLGEHPGSVTVNLGPAAALGVELGDWIVATATDAVGNSSEFSGAIEVIQANLPPYVDQAITDLTLLLGGPLYTADLDTVFADPNGDDLTYTATSTAPAVATVDFLSGNLASTIRITPVAAGQTTIIVVAEDPDGLQAQMSFVVTVNTAPTVVMPIPNQQLQQGGVPFETNLNQVFLDPDGDLLTYTVSVTNPLPVVTSIQQGSILRVEGVAGGTTTLIVTADDGGGGQVQTSFQVTVIGLNGPPVVTSPVPNTTLFLNSPQFIVGLETVFTDPESDPLTFTASSTNPAVATGLVQALSALVVTPVAVGTATILMTADDGNGGQTQTSFVVTVVDGNAPPVVSVPIANQTLPAGGPQFVTNLATTFNDPNGDALLYTPSSSNPAVATALVLGTSTLAVSPLAVGVATIVVTAADGHGGQTQTSFTVTVVNGNLPPVVAVPIANQTLPAGGPQFVANLAAAFTDPNGDVLTYTPFSSNPLVATAQILGTSTLAVSPLAVGVTTVVVTAADGFGGQTQTSFTVTVVNGNLPPVVSSALVNSTLQLGGPQFVAALDTVFTDPNGDALLFTATSTNPAVATALIQGPSALIVTQLAVGTTTILVTADDGQGGQVQTSVVITVDAADGPTVSTPISDQQLQTGGPQFVIDLNSVFTDPNGDILTFTAASTSALVATAVIESGSTLAVTPLTVGTTTVVVTANDGNGGQAQTSFVVTVAEGNQAPVAGTIANQQLTVGGPQFVVDLNTVFTDADGDPLVFTASSTNEEVATAVIQGTSALTVTPLAGGTAIIVVTADDGQGGQAQTTFMVDINARPAVLAEIPFQRLEVGDPPFTVDLATIFSDPNPDDALTFTANVAPAGVVTVNIASGSILSVTAVQSGSVIVTVMASDGNGGQAQTSFQVTVGAVNTPPAPANLANLTLPLGGDQVVIDLSTLFTDVDEDPLTFTALSTNDAIVTAVVLGTSVLTLTPIGLGQATVIVTASDGQGGQTQSTFEVTVSEGNQAPLVLGVIEPPPLSAGGQQYVVNLANIFSDPDGDPLTFSAISTNEAVATAVILGSSFLTVTPVAIGTATIIAQASDGRGQQAETIFLVTVGEANAPPTVAVRIPNQELAAGGPPLVIDLNTVFSDPDGNLLTFGATTADDAVARARVSGTSLLTVTPITAGTTLITVEATDGRSAPVSTSFEIIVVEGNVPPEVVSGIDSQELEVGGAPFSTNLADVFTDLNGDPLTFTATSNNEAAATATLLGSSLLTVSPVAPGLATILITANDGIGGVVQTSFQVSVREANSPPVTVQPIAGRSMISGDPAFTVDLSTVFADPDPGDRLTFTAVSSASAVAEAGITGASTLTVRPVAAGDAIITVKAQDLRGATDSTFFAISVAARNRPPVIVNAIPAQLLDLGGEPTVLNLKASFVDPDGDPLTYSSASENPGVATAIVADTLLVLRPVGLGTTTITVTIDDGRGQRIVTSFPATVFKNNLPNLTRNIGSQQLLLGDSLFTANLLSFFSDPDNDDSLSFSATSSNGEVAIADIVNDVMLVVTPLTAGSSRINVTATDLRNGTRKTSFMVEIRQPPGDSGFVLEQNYPNPFNPTTVIEYTVPASADGSFVRLDVYDSRGRLVKRLVRAEQRAAGKYRTLFDATGLPSGIYYYRLQTSAFIQTRALTLIK